MSAEKKEKVMTAKGFLFKATTKAAVSAQGFLAQYRSFLETGELAEKTSPILRRLDDNEILPTPALDAIKSVVLTHMLAKECAAAEDKILNPPPGATPKNWIASIYNSDGELQVKVSEEDGEETELQKGFDHPQDAERWADRRLFEGESNWYGVVAHSTIITKSGEPMHTVISREDSMARILKQPKPAVSKKVGVRDSKLSWGAKVSQDRCHFSKG